MRGAVWALAAVAALLTGGAVAAEDRFWILWERINFIGQHCPDGASCLVKKSYTSRPLETENEAFIYRLFGVSGGGSNRAFAVGEHPDAPTVCSANQSSLTLGFDPEALPRSEKVEVLRGVKAVHVDLTGLRSPPGFSDGFGERVHQRFVRILTGAGIRVVDKDAVAHLPGQPVMNLYFSFTDPDHDCDYEYSVFASLSQNVLLARDLRIKIPAGVWSFSTGSTEKDHTGTEEDAILRIAEAFVRDHSRVNNR
ncbi:hypothetical protein [Shimia sp. Alg240-R146]|uniref:hypothetical protein n=1 Tax=Shimia sp. Alg240-R146 TaxID=2993449 RepID=UPI0022E3CB3D|nr:hypothetical protein [Shimia sp. Alg240-R146]